MKALQFSRKPARYAAAMVAGKVKPGSGARYGPLALRDLDEPELPGPGWVRVRPILSGICGSDLATIDGASSRYFEPIVSFPFVPGHEVVGETEDGRRVVLIPVLGCAARGIDPPCHMCADDRINLCERIAFGHLEPGLQTGFCESTGGGWSTMFVAHESQLLEVPPDLTDEQAMMVEPAACAIHAATPHTGEQTAVIGAGTLGLLTLAAIGADNERQNLVLATAKHPEQRRLANELGATVVVAPDELARAARSATGSMVIGEHLTCGIDLVYDCVGSEDSLRQALQVVSPGGTIVLVGMPASVTLDLTSLWHREVSLRGSYAYTREDFAAALDLVRDADLGRLVSATYPLARFEDAIEHAANAGGRGAVKIAFDLRKGTR